MQQFNTIDLQEKFREDGFVYLPGFFQQAEVEDIHRHLNKLISEAVPSMPPEQAFYEDRNDPSTLKQVQTLFSYDPFFNEMMFGSRFEELASVLLQGNVRGMNMQYFNKPPLTGKATPPHQDGYYFMLEPNEAVTMWLALEEADEENGCVRYVKGSHLKGMRPHGKTETLGFSQGITDYGTTNDLLNEIFFNAKAGDLLVHHALTIHRAENNKSAHRTRKSLGFIYYSAIAKENTEAKKEYQQKLATEIRQKAQS